MVRKSNESLQGHKPAIVFVVLKAFQYFLHLRIVQRHFLCLLWPQHTRFVVPLRNTHTRTRTRTYTHSL
jgi:hypothetical protein